MRENETIYKNGTRLFMYNRPSEHKFKLEFTINIGSLNENRLNLGFSHFIGNVVSSFPSIKYPNPKENEELFAELAFDVNASTNPEFCDFYIEGLNEYLDIAIDIVMSFLSKPLWIYEKNDKILKKILKNELKIIHNELVSEMDKTWYETRCEINKITFNNTPFSYTTEEEYDNIKNMNIKTFKKHYFKFFNPHNIFIYFTINDKKHQYIHDKLNDWNDYLNKYIEPIEINQIPNIIKPIKKNYFIKSDNREYLIQFCIFLPEFFNVFDVKTSQILDIITQLFNEFLSSRFVKELRLDNGLVYTIDIDHTEYICDGYGWFEIEIYTSEDNVEQVINIIKHNIDNFKKITKKEYTQLKNTELMNYDEIDEKYETHILSDMCNKPILTDKTRHEMFLQLIKDNLNNNYIEKFVEKYFKNNYYIFVSGKKNVMKY